MQSVKLLAKLKPGYNVSDVTDRTVIAHMLRRRWFSSLQSFDAVILAAVLHLVSSVAHHDL